MSETPVWMLGPVGRKRVRIEKLQDKYLREKVLSQVHVAIQHRAVCVLVLPKFVAGMRFKIKRVK
jgi:hypothetical protein